MKIPPLVENFLALAVVIAIGLFAVFTVSSGIGHGEALSDEIVSSEELIALNFTADWCPACRTLAPVLDELRGEFAGRIGIVVIDVDANPELSDRYDISILPSVVLFKNRVEVDRMVGGKPAASYRKWFNGHL